jgi:hypothetical protein
MLSRVRIPTKEEINDKTVKYPKKPIYHGMGYVIYR